MQDHEVTRNYRVMLESKQGHLEAVRTKAINRREAGVNALNKINNDPRTKKAGYIIIDTVMYDCDIIKYKTTEGE